jgi:phage-related protein
LYKCRLTPVEWLGDSRQDIRLFSPAVLDALGKQLLTVQRGQIPSDFKPMPSIGKGVYEIRVRLGGAWRLIYVAKLEPAIYVRHVFQKKTPQTSTNDIELAKKRYRTLGVER